MTYGEMLQEYLDEKGMTAADIAKALGVSRSSINFLMHGDHEPSFGRAKAIADILGVSLQEMADRLYG